MGDQIISSAVTVMMAIVGLAIIVGVTGRSFSGALAAAEAPVLGGFGLNVAGTQAYSGYQF